MKAWMIITLIIGLVVTASILVISLNVTSADSSSEDLCSISRANTPSQCSETGNTCTQGSNCGLSTCETVRTGKTCGCS